MRQGTGMLQQPWNFQIAERILLREEVETLKHSELTWNRFLPLSGSRGWDRETTDISGTCAATS